MSPDSTPTPPAPNGRGIVVRGVHKAFGGEPALPPTDLDVPPGRPTLLTGRNGAGKTTLVRVLATLVLPDGGTATVDGLDPARQGRLVRERIGVALVNDRSVYWRLSVLQNLALVAHIRGVAREQRDDQAREALAAVGLEHLEARPAHALSAGQRQRVVLARALLGSPPVLLIDEPLRGLDDEAIALVLGTLRTHAERGATVLVAAPAIHEFGDWPDAVHAVGDRIAA